MKTAGYGDAIRGALRGAKSPPLSAEEIARLLTESGMSVDMPSLHYSLGRRARAKELLRHHDPRGILTYSLNPAYKPSPAIVLAGEPAPAPTLPPMLPAVRAAIRADRKLRNARTDAAAAAALVARAAPSTEPAQLVATPTERAIYDAAARDAAPPVFGLASRCHAVATDIEDLIGDACDRELPHTAIKALVTAQCAISRAALALAG